VFRGPEGVRQFVEQWLDAFEELDVQVERLVPIDDHIVACVHQRGRSTSGVPVEMRDGHVWTVADGRVTRVAMYFTHDAALAAARAGG
jgi:ketosteroid isomerase-like protein